MFRISCPQCHTKVELAGPPANGIAQCPKCGQKMRVPGAAAKKPGDSGMNAASPAPAPRHAAAAPPRPMPPRHDDEDHPRQRRRDYDEEDYRPSRKRKKSERSSNTLALVIGGSVAALVLIGVAVILFFALREGEKQQDVAQGPQGPQAPYQPPPGPGGRDPGRPGQPPPGFFDGSEGGVPPGTPPGGRRSPPNQPPPSGSRTDEGKVAESNTNSRDEAPASSEQPKDFGGAAGGGNTGTGVYPYLLKSAAFIIVLMEVQTAQGPAYGVATGSGALIDRKNRLVLTNHHVAGTAKEVVVFFPTYRNGKLVVEKDRFINQFKGKDKDVIKAKVLATEMRCDLCLLQVDRVPDGIEALPLSKTQATPGQQVHSIGSPGSSGGLWVYTSGTVRQVYHKQWQSGDGAGRFSEHDADVVETQSPTNQGDSGGPLVNDRGELVAVTHGGSSRAQLVSLFIDLAEVRQFVGNTVESRLGMKWISDARPPLQFASRSGGGNITDLVKKLEHADAEQRARAAEALGDLGENAKVAIPSLLKALKDRDEFTRRTAAASLNKIGLPAKSDVPLLAAGLKDEHVEVRQYAVATLAKMGPDAQPAADALVTALKDKESGVRQAAARALGQLGAQVKSSAVPELTALLDHTEKDTRRAAAEGLAGMLTTAADLPALQKMTKHQDAEVRSLAFKSVGKLGSDAKALLPELLEAAKTDRGDARKAALMLLATLTAAEAKPVIPLISQALKDGDKETRQLSLQVVAKLGNDSTSLINPVRDALKDPEVCKDALAALGKLGANARNAVPAMAECLKSEDEGIRDAALKSLGELGINGAAATNEVINLFDKARDFKTREEGSVYLDKIAPVVAKFGRPAVPSLIKALQEDNAMIRWGACRALGLMGSVAREADRHLIALAQVDQNVFIVQEAEKARRKITAR